jgi:hypothetical protein
MKKYNLILVVFLITRMTFSQEIVYVNYFEDSANWELFADTVGAGTLDYALAEINSNRLNLICNQVLGCPEAHATLRVKNDFLEDNKYFELKISFLTTRPSFSNGHTDYVKLVLNKANLIIHHELLNYIDGCDLLIQSKDSVRVFVKTSTGQQQITDFDLDIIEKSDSLKLEFSIKACGADAFHSSEMVIDTIQIIDLGTCNDTTINDTITYYVHTKDFEPVSPKVYMESTDSLVAAVDGCVRIINKYSKYVYDSIFITTIYDSISVTDTLIIDVIITGGISSDVSGRIKVYPNPAKEFLFINSGIQFNQTDYKIKIFNINGSVVFESKITRELFVININDFNQTGLFFIQIIDNTDKIIHTKKLILE